jgi:hypothetical protein
VISSGNAAALALLTCTAGAALPGGSGPDDWPAALARRSLDANGWTRRAVMPPLVERGADGYAPEMLALLGSRECR